MERKKENRFFYYFFLLISVAGIILLLRRPIGRAVTHIRENQSTTAQRGGVTLIITAQKATELAAELISAGFMSEPTIGFENGEVRLEATVSVSELIPTRVQQSYPELGMLVRMLPQNERLGVGFEVSAENGELLLELKRLSVRGYGLPLGLLPKEIREDIGALILSGSGADRLGLKITSVTAEDGCLTLKAE